jgi:hypothetical protein
MTQIVVWLVTTFPDSRVPKVQERGLQELSTGLYQSTYCNLLLNFLKISLNIILAQHINIICLI